MPHAPHHWDAIYQRSAPASLGWYESDPQPSLDLIRACKLPKGARIFHAGAGASTLIDALLEEGYTAQIACDLSAEALEKAQERLGPQAEQITWIVDDLTAPTLLRDSAPVDLWHDRAVLHFFTNEKDQDTYFDLLRKMVKPGGFVIIAAYNLSGADQCAGLPVKRYNIHMLTSLLGPDFQLVETLDHLYYMPSGAERPYVYGVFERG